LKGFSVPSRKPLFFIWIILSLLEEQIAVVYHVSLQVKLIHETAGGLHSHLALLL
jgi:hypothetical protein